MQLYFLNLWPAFKILMESEFEIIFSDSRDKKW